MGQLRPGPAILLAEVYIDLCRQISSKKRIWIHYAPCCQSHAPHGPNLFRPATPLFHPSSPYAVPSLPPHPHGGLSWLLQAPTVTCQPSSQHAWALHHCKALYSTFVIVWPVEHWHRPSLGLGHITQLDYKTPLSFAPNKYFRLEGLWKLFDIYFILYL